MAENGASDVWAKLLRQLRDDQIDFVVIGRRFTVPVASLARLRVMKLAIARPLDLAERPTQARLPVPRFQKSRLRKRRSWNAAISLYIEAADFS